jgi:hypothetical protein
MSTPISRRISESDSFVSSSESLVESSSDETPALDKQSKSLSPPVMKTKTKKSDLCEAYKANASSSSNSSSSSSSSATYTEKNNDIGKTFKKEIDTARKLNAKKEQWAAFSKQINPWGELKLEGLKSEEIQDLADWLRTSASAKVTGLELRCEYNALREMDCKAAKALSSAIQTNTTITTLVITNSWIDDTTAKCFADAIQANRQTKITNLDLGSNKIGNEGANALAEMLKTNTTINTLCLCWNQIRNEGDKAIAQAIKANPQTKITTLDLENNLIGNPLFNSET